MKEMIVELGGAGVHEGQMYRQQSIAKGQVKNKWFLDSIG
jgi:hypothetical protein